MGRSFQELLPAVGDAMSEPLSAASSFQICLSWEEPSHCRSHLFCVACIWGQSKAGQWALLTPELPASWASVCVCVCVCALARVCECSVVSDFCDPMD